MLKIDAVNIQDVYLLSKEEAGSIPQEIRASGRLWWLRTPGSVDNNVAVVNWGGSVIGEGVDIQVKSCTVRPAVKIKDLDSMNLEIGETVMIFGRLARYIGNDSVLLCEHLSYHRFDAESNDFEKSEVKRYLEKVKKNIAKSFA